VDYLQRRSHEWPGKRHGLGQLSRDFSLKLLESRYEGMVYIVFPGNVGKTESLAEIVSIMKS
jgi:hypothetical protein